MKLVFEWDKRKAASNLRKHKISFDEAKSVFADEFALTFRDDLHSDEEERYLTLGRSFTRRVLLVVHTEIDRLDEHVTIRIISCRKATKGEIKTYEKGNE